MALNTYLDGQEPADAKLPERRWPYGANSDGRSRRFALVVASVGVFLAGCGVGTDPADAGPASAVSASPSPVESTSTTAASTALQVEPDDTDTQHDEPPTTDGDQLVVPAQELPTDAETLAQALVEAERAVRDQSLPKPLLSQWGQRQQALYRRLSFHPDWFEPVLGSVSDDVAEAVALNWEARENLIALLATEKRHDTMPAWRVEEPPPAAELLSYYQEAEELTGISWEYVAAINLVETRMGRIQGVSTAGAIGPMQFLPTTWAECCVGDPTNPRDAVIGAATYLTVRGGPDNMSKAIWGYNNSDYYVNAVTAYAEVMMADERAYYGYHGWEIYFLTTEGLVAIPVGYEQKVEIPVVDWLQDHPEALITG